MTATLAALVVTLATLVGVPAVATAVSPDGAPAASTVESRVVQMADLTKFDPSNIISDALFYDRNAMTAAQIQSFLDQKIGACSNGKCLNISNVSVSSRAARYSTSTGNLICGAITGGTMKASELIYRMQVACGISAKVILVTLQKEQGLTTSRAPSDWNLTAAMGQACPDHAPCDPAFKGLGPQIVGGVTQLKTYQAARFGKQPGNNFIQYSPHAPCGGTTINIKNWATASLYSYTPYQPNAASLRAGYGTGDSCSSYGNRNFYNYYTDWFGSTQGGGNPCAQPASAKKAVKTYVVTATALNGRAGPSTSCNSGVVSLPRDTVLQAVAVDGDWLKVHYESSDKWVHRDYLRYATAEEGACAIPGGVASAKYAYVVSSASTTMRSSPTAACASGAESASEGSILQAVSVSADKLWVKVSAGTVPKWVVRTDLRRASAAETVCALPGGVSSAKLYYVIRDVGTTGRAAPRAECATGAVAVSGGTVVQAMQTNGPRDWLYVSTGRGDVWIDRSQATQLSGAPACDVRALSRPAKNTYVVEGDTTGRVAPAVTCETGATVVPAGTVLSPSASTPAGDWLLVKLPEGERWIPRSTVRGASVAEACQTPAGTKTAQFTYRVEQTTTGRSAPQNGCPDGSVSVASGSVAQATAVTAAGDWLLLSFPEGEKWIFRAHTTRYSGD